MADYAAIKAEIDANVKRNAQNAITGEKLNGVLNDMVDALGAEFQVVGVAQPTDTPTAGDSKIAYIAGPGTYADFGALVVPDLCVGILKYDGVWSVEYTQIVDLTDYATKEYVNGILSDALAATNAANEAARNANEKAALVQGRLDTADSDHLRAVSDHNTAAADHTLAASDHTTAAADHTLAAGDHTTAAADHVTAAADHVTAVSDHETWAGYRVVVTSVGSSAPASPSSGDKWYNTSDNKIYSYSGSAWDSGVAATTGATVVNSTDNAVYVFNGLNLDNFKEEVDLQNQKFGTAVTLAESAPSQTVATGKSVKGSDGSLTNSTLYDVVAITVTGAKRVRFLGVRTTTAATSGYAFYNSGGTCVKSEAWRSGAVELSPEEYIIDVPKDAVTFKAGRRNEYSTLSYYYVQTGDSVTDLLADKIGKKLGANLWDGTIAVTGRYLNSTGGTNANSSYSYTDYIEVEAETDYHLSAKNDAKVANSSSMYLRYYNASLEDIGGKSSYNLDFTTPANCKYVRFTLYNTKTEIMFQKGTARTAYEPYAPIGGYWVNLQEKQVQYSNLNDDLRALWSQHFDSLRGSATLAAGESLTLSTVFCKMNVVMAAHIEGVVETIKVGIGNTGLTNYLCYVIELTQTSLKMTRADTGTVTFNVSHGLTLTTHTTLYIDTENTAPADVADNNTIRVNVTVSNNLGESFTQNCDNYWGYGTPFIINANSSASVDADLSFFPKDILKKVWLFGDSYLEFTYQQKRLPYWLWLNNYHGFMLCAKGGMTQADVLPVFQTLLNQGHKPAFAVWMVGMNDGVDSSASSVNSTAKSNIDAFVSLCQANHITPILQTTPTVPTRQHTALASYVRSLGVRYIDVAEAVGCDSSGNWYTGLLGDDGVHPTAAGSKVIFQQVLLDFPEIAVK